jgi:hypothetical protein
MRVPPTRPELESYQTVTSKSNNPALVQPAVPRRATGALRRRRNYLVDPAYQIRTAAIAVVGMAFVVGVAAGLLHLLQREHRIAVLGEPATRTSSPGWALFLVVAGAALVAAVFVIEILETHKTAGVVLRLIRGLRRIESGAWGSRVTLRKQDNFRELEVAFNDAARALCERTEEEIRMLDRLMARIDLLSRELDSGDPGGGGLLIQQITEELERLREGHRNMLRSAPDLRFEPKI